MVSTWVMGSLNGDSCKILYVLVTADIWAFLKDWMLPYLHQSFIRSSWEWEVPHGSHVSMSELQSPGFSYKYLHV